MKNRKRNGIGVSEPGLQSTAHSLQLREGGEKGGSSRSRQSTVHSRQLRETGAREGRAAFEAQAKAFVPQAKEGRLYRGHYQESGVKPPHSTQGRYSNAPRGDDEKGQKGGSSRSRQSTVKSRQRRGTQEREGRGAQKEIDAKALWRQVEDVVVAQLGLSVIDHVVYMHLLRHSQLEGKRRLHFSIPWLAHNINLSTCPTREAVRRLASQGVVRLVERSKAGHVAEVRLPEEVRGVRVRARAAARAREAARKADPSNIEKVDFLKTLELRRTIHARERGRCFYCLRRVAPRLECLDHVVPRARVGCNSYRNLVSACMECNAQKGEQPAEEYLRWLFREHRLGAAELRGRFEALELLAAGKLRPALPSQDGPK